MLHKLKSKAGFTLVEMMVVAGVIGVLAIGFSAYMYQQTKHLNAGRDKGAMVDLQTNVLNSTGKEDALLQTESLQKSVLTSGPTITGCYPPCAVAFAEDGVTPACVYDCRDPHLHGVCTVLEPPCVYIFLSQCTCRGGGSGDSLSNGNSEDPGDTRP